MFKLSQNAFVGEGRVRTTDRFKIRSTTGIVDFDRKDEVTSQVTIADFIECRSEKILVGFVEGLSRYLANIGFPIPSKDLREIVILLISLKNRSVSIGDDDLFDLIEILGKNGFHGDVWEGQCEFIFKS